MVVKTVISNGAFDLNTSTYSGDFILNINSNNISQYVPYWSIPNGTNGTTLGLAKTGTSSGYNIPIGPNGTTQCVLIQNNSSTTPFILSQNVPLSIGTYSLSYNVATMNINTYQKFSTSISSNMTSTDVLIGPTSINVGGWNSFSHVIYILTPGQYSIDFTFTNTTDVGDRAMYFTNVILTKTLNIPCFLQGSKILTLNLTTNFEEYVPIENLRKGDLIKTYSNGYKELAYIGSKKVDNPSTNTDSKERLYRFSKSKIRELKEDLCITGRHCVLHRTISGRLREQLIEHMGDVYSTEELYRVQAWMDDRAEPYKDASPVTVWHIALENENIYHNYGVWANGLLVETCSIIYLTKISDMELVH